MKHHKMTFPRTGMQMLAFCLGLLPAMASQALLLDLAEKPISVVSNPNPNVMLLLDNSGSMFNINWHADFNPATSYTKWCDSNCTAGDRWDTTSLYMKISSINSGDYDTVSSGAEPDTHQCTTPSGASGGINVMGISNTDPTLIRCLYLPGSIDSYYTGNYLNFLFETYGEPYTIVEDANSSSDTITHVSKDLADGTIPTDLRVDTVRSVVTNDIISIKGVNFGLAQFYGGTGANIFANCGDVTTANIGTYMDSYIATSSTPTPLGEALYEITRYFRGLDHFYDGSDNGKNSNSKYTSPIEYVCQGNYALVLTDGMATYDSEWPTSASDDADLCGTIDCGSGDDPNWDGEAPTEPDTVPPFAQFSDGHGDGDVIFSETIYTDDIAKFAYDIDMATGLLDGVDSDLPPYAKQNMRTVTIGFGIDLQVLKDAAYYGNGSVDESRYFNANTEADLQTALISAINEIKGDSQTSSFSSVAASTGYFIEGSSLYQGLYEFNAETEIWSGHLIKYPIEDDGSVGSAGPNAATVLDQTSVDNRKIFSYDPVGGTGILFDTSSGGLTTAQQDTLGGKFVVDYIRGVRDCEAINSTAAKCTETIPDEPDVVHSFRDRQSVLGTIINSSSLFIPKPSSIYPDNWGADAPENTSCNEGTTTGCYSTFKENYKSRKNMIYVGANDGMLHAFDPDDMSEVFAYVPAKVISKLSTFANPSHSHKYYVDGTPTVIDAYDSVADKWRTILVGSLNKGGQGIFALDITEVGKDGVTLTKEDVLWEYTDTEGGHINLGYTYSRPAIVRMHNGKWLAVFGNGYNNTESDGAGSTSTTGNAVLYFVDLFTGNLVHRIDTQRGLLQDPANSDLSNILDSRPNGLSGVAPIDINNDMIVDYIYAGDIYGNMWRFDITDTVTTNWKIYGKSSNTTGPIFVAKYTDSEDNVINPQSITSRPEVARAGPNGVMLYFGTGLYMGANDNLDVDNVQTFYGLLDDPLGDSASSTEVTRVQMQPQTFTQTTDLIDGQTQIVREFSNKVIPDSAYKSWFIDLYDGTTKEGERVVTTPLVRGATHKRVIFVSIIPSAKACTGGGRSWLIELNARNGNRTQDPVFDLNYDGKLNSLDNGSGTTVYNGWSQDGIQTTPTVIVSEGLEHKYMSGSSGTVTSIGESLPKGAEGRQSWRQIK